MIKSGFKAVLLSIMIAILCISLLPQKSEAAAPLPKREMRAAWIVTVGNGDMKAGMTASQYTAWARQTLDGLKGNGFNAVIFQVKPTSDALYESNLAPWSSYITGKKQGTNPGYDPLKIMIDEAHKRGMELHAWMNPYRVTMPSQSLSDLAANNAARKNPGWVVKYGKQYYLNPGLPAVQNYLVDSVKELVAKYDVDAVHMDDYFYPYKIANETFPDQAAFKQYGGSYKNVADWRRNNVNQLVKNLYNGIKATKPHVQFGISPFGVWRNQSLDPTGSATTAGVNNYDDLYADTRTWIKNGTIDYITPQVYWSKNMAAARYNTLLNWWSKEVNTYANTHPVNLYLGVADYKVATDTVDKTWNDKMELPNQISSNRANGTADGQMHFSTRSIQANKLGYMSIIKQQLYNTKAVTPAVPWKNSSVPAKPTAVQVKKETAGRTISITDQNATQARKYVIYRFNGNAEGSYEDPRNIVDVVYNTGGQTVFTDKTASAGSSYTYGVRSLSATGVESSTAFVVREAGNGSFADVTASHRAYKEVSFLAKEGITQGDANGLFLPGQTVTRAEAAAMLGRALNLNGTKRDSVFTDVGPGMFASGYIQSAVDRGIFSGYKDGSFKPYGHITRGEMALMISRAFGYEYNNSASAAQQALMSRGIALGMSDGQFGAQYSIIRADFAVFLARALDPSLRVQK